MVQSYLPGGTMCLPMWAHWRHLVNTTELMLLLPLTHLSPQSKRKSIGSAILTQLTAESLYLQWALLSPKIVPSNGGIWTSNTWFPAPTRVANTNGISIGSAIFAQTTAECPYTLQFGTPLSPQNCPFPWVDLDPI